MDSLERAKKIVLLVFDVDGTLTDGSIHLGVNGELSKVFNVKDGLGIGVALKLGFLVAFITGRKSDILLHRAKELGVVDVYQGVKDKVGMLERLCLEKGCCLEQVAYMGDDLNDLAVMRQVGLVSAPLDAVSEVIEVAQYISEYKGGHGAVRDFIEYVLKSQGLWQNAVQLYTKEGYGVQ